MSDTIIAIATPPGRGGVGILRLSGKLSYTIAQTINQQKKLPVRKAVYCNFYAGDSLLDQGLMIFFKGPHSFTGEDVVEIHAHGSPLVLDLLLKTAVQSGARLARPGEFSERAFLNDKIDLIQAEAIADLIQASSETAAKMALKSLQGEFSKHINKLNERIIHLRLFVEAAIDFPDEEIDFLNDGKIAGLLSDIIDDLNKIRSQVNQGIIMREGLSVVIAGRPNAGKSTLINYLSGREVAIVTDIAGTTRDVMREHILLDDIPLHLVDTAGLRESQEQVEKEGIQRAWNEIQKADVVLLLADINESMDKNLETSIEKTIPADIPVIRIFNKIDTITGSLSKTPDAIYISAKSGKGIDELKDRIKRSVGYQPLEGQFLARRRHLNALNKASELLVEGQLQLQCHQAGELLAEDLRQAHEQLAEITGEFSSDDLLGKIFSSFCIGK